MKEIGLAILLAIGVLWMKLTTPEQRKMVLGYLILLSVIATIISLFTGQGPYSNYGPDNPF